MSLENARRSGADATEVLAALGDPPKNDDDFRREAALFRDVSIKCAEAVASKNEEAVDLKLRLSRINDAYDPSIGSMRSLGEALKERLETFADARIIEQSQTIEEASRRAALGDREGAARLLEKADGLLPPIGCGVSVIRRMQAIVDQLEALPKEMVEVTPLLTRIKKALVSGADVPGAHLTMKTSVSTRGGKKK